MPALEKKQRFIPFRQADVVAMCSNDQQLSREDKQHFQNICQLLSSIYHFKFHKSLEMLKECYAPINPDADTKLLYKKDAQQKALLEANLISELTQLLNAANFEEITKTDLDQALLEESLFKIRLHIDFDDFEQVLFFRRGESTREETIVSWFGLRKKQIRFTNFDRVVVYVKLKEQSYFDQQKRKTAFFTPGSTMIKLFKNVPRSDLEMLFPNTEVKMKTIDKLIIGIPAAVGGVIMLVTKLGATLILVGAMLGFWIGLHDKPVLLDQAALIGLAAGFGTLGAFLWKQFSNFKNRKIKFMKTLADNLYFKNLDNNTGVFHRLIDAAEEEECKEVIIAYYFLLRAKKSLTVKELDQSIEDWFQENYQTKINFEIDDALEKLTQMGLLKTSADKLSVTPLQDAQVKLDAIWDGYFNFNYTD